jgi:ABC-2 type transport system permease protein/oleandomycin transport system permease protein
LHARSFRAARDIVVGLASGMIDRFRSLPIAGPAVLAGRAAADAVRNLFVVSLMTAMATPLGFRFHAGPAAALAAVALAVGVGVAFSWLNLLAGLAVRDAESAGLAGLFSVVILVFTSSTLVPVATMPGSCRPSPPISRSPPPSTLRALCLGGPSPGSPHYSPWPCPWPSPATAAPPARRAGHES